MAQTLLGDGNVTATGRVSGGTVRAPSLAAYEYGTDGSLSNLNTALAAKQDALTAGPGISISQNYKWNTSNFGTLYTKSVPAVGMTVPAYTNVECTATSSDVDSIGSDGTNYVPVKNGSSIGMGTATLVGQTDDHVISALPIPLTTATAGGTLSAQDGHAYYYSFAGTAAASGDVIISFPSTTGVTDALMFQVSFNNTSTTTAMSVVFNSTDVVKFDSSDCGTVKASGAAILSAMWNGTAWDLIWKNKS